ncbi:MAG: lipoyl synthase [Kiritimatiellia bacterium]|nr:lipoyl synthase [Lentisphaerota bacterium]
MPGQEDRPSTDTDKLKHSRLRLPPWIRVRAPADGFKLDAVHRTLRATGLPTVCESAHCPNRAECFARGTATVMILGEICTRDCRFCAVTHGTPQPPAPDEPERVAELARRLKLRYVVVTSVTRDDLPDGGAGVFAAVIRQLKSIPVQVEVLTPDFQGHEPSIATVIQAEPDVFNHNLETVRRLQALIRPQADYQRSLEVLRMASRMDSRVTIKSGLMLGLGETDAELREALRDLRAQGCMALTLGQYLAPSRNHHPVERFVPPAEFDAWRQTALEMGFAAVAAGPLVRSSYRADELAAAD